MEGFGGRRWQAQLSTDKIPVTRAKSHATKYINTDGEIFVDNHKK